MIERLKKFQDSYNLLDTKDRNRFIGRLDTDKAIKPELKILARHFLNMALTSCGNCYVDAFMRLMKIKTNDMKTMEYALLNGTLLHDPVNKDAGMILTPQSLMIQGEELALRHIAFNKKALEMFTKFPEDIEERVEKYLAENKELGEAVDVRKSSMKIKLEALKSEYEAAAVAAEKAKEKLEAFSKEVSTLGEVSKPKIRTRKGKAVVEEVKIEEPVIAEAVAEEAVSPEEGQ